MAASFVGSARAGMITYSASGCRPKMMPVNSVLRLLPAATFGAFPAPCAAAVTPASNVLSTLLLLLAKLVLRAVVLLREGAAGEGGMLAPASMCAPVILSEPKGAPLGAPPRTAMFPSSNPLIRPAAEPTAQGPQALQLLCRSNW